MEQCLVGRKVLGVQCSTLCPSSGSYPKYVAAGWPALHLGVAALVSQLV